MELPLNTRGLVTASNSIGLSRKLNSYFVTGFCDGESYFNVSISKNPKFKVG
jgi:hypothetical protein